MENLDKLVRELCSQPTETDWLEFKSNNYDPEMIGRDISALSNSATYQDRDCAYMVWGIDDATHKVVGTSYNKFSKLNGTQEAESWLRTFLSKNVEFDFYETVVDGKAVVVLIIQNSKIQPVTFKKDAYIRVGSYTKRLNEYPSMEAKLWDKLRAERFEEQIAKNNVTKDDIVQLLDTSVYFDMQGIAVPSNIDKILYYYLEEKIVIKNDDGTYAITNLGALLLAKNLSEFPTVRRKAIRVISYADDTKFKILKQFDGIKGYAVGFEGLLQFLEAILPSEEVITSIRRTSQPFPLIALREIIANALIHQDLSIQGTSPLIEVFKTRIEITNPGRPIIDVNRIVDNPARSRNEILANLMRHLGLCEEAGSGWDRVLVECENNKLPAPQVEIYEENTKVTLFSNIPFVNLKESEKIWSCYLHACLKYVSEHEGITNKTLRTRLGLNDSMSAPVSRLLKKCADENLLKPFDPEADSRHTKYVPYWA